MPPMILPRIWGVLFDAPWMCFPAPVSLRLGGTLHIACTGYANGILLRNA